MKARAGTPWWLESFLPDLPSALRWLRPSTRPRPVPAVRLALGPRVPSWVLRLLLGAVAMGCGLLVIGPPMGLVTYAVLVVATIIRPDRILPVIVLLSLATASILDGLPPLSPTGFILLAGGPLVVTLGALLGGISWRAWVELRVLLLAGRRYLALQAIAQPLAWLGGWLLTRQISAALVPILGCAALAALVLLVQRSLARADR